LPTAWVIVDRCQHYDSASCCGSQLRVVDSRPHDCSGQATGGLWHPSGIGPASSWVSPVQAACTPDDSAPQNGRGQQWVLVQIRGRQQTPGSVAAMGLAAVVLVLASLVAAASGSGKPADWINGTASFFEGPQASASCLLVQLGAVWQQHHSTGASCWARACSTLAAARAAAHSSARARAHYHDPALLPQLPPLRLRLSVRRRTAETWPTT
jgi:hypothetical protein